MERFNFYRSESALSYNFLFYLITDLDFENHFESLISVVIKY
jgi:hypothetical protein